jgi:hypothetical protein
MTNFQNEFQELFRFTFQETFSKSSSKQSSSEPESFVKLFSDSFSESFLFSFSKAYAHPSNDDMEPKEIHKEETKSTSGSSSSASSRIKNRIKQKLKDNSSRHSLSLDELKKTPESKELRKSLSILENKSVSIPNGLKGIKDALDIFPVFKEKSESNSYKGVTMSPLDEISEMFLDDSFGESIKMFSELEKKSESTTKNTIFVSNAKGEEKKKDIFSSKSFEFLISKEFSNLFKKSIINENKK